MQISPEEPDFLGEHLQAELARIDLYLQLALLRWRKAGQDPHDAFRGLYIADQEVDSLLSRPFATNWGSTTEPTQKELERFNTAIAQAEQRVNDCVERLGTAGVTSHLLQIRETFNLDAFEFDAFLVCLAPSLDLRYERIYGYLQDDVTRRRPTVNLILDLLAPSGPERLPLILRFSQSAPLLTSGLVRPIHDPGRPEGPVLSQTLAVDETVISWILGEYQPQGNLLGSAHLSYPQDNEADQLLAGNQLARLPSGAETLAILALTGPDTAAQAAAARLWSANARRPLLQVDLQSEAHKEPGNLADTVRMVLRDGRLTGAVVYIKNMDQSLQGTRLEAEVANLLAAHPESLILSSREAWLPAGPLRSRQLFLLSFQIPDYAQRMEIWRQFFPSSTEPNPDLLSELAGQFYLTAGQILDSLATARDRAAQGDRPLDREDLFAAARAHSNPSLASLANQIEPRYQWPDLVLPEDQLSLLQELIATVRGRPQVLDGWGVGRKLASSRGVTALFAGPPGTGKTMAAEIIAGELGLDLFKIDLSTIVSKYIGETEKNLERIFQEASASNAILFFDEADALFGKRSEVRDSHDRYANIEISYLLQRMEAYDGVTILATNLRANLDEAFTRRLHFSVDFPFPEAPDRRRIWHTLFPPTLPRAPGLDLDALANRFKLAGGNIRNILVSAAYLAAADGGRVTMDHLLHGTRRELQKMGRLVDALDLAAPVMKPDQAEIDLP